MTEAILEVEHVVPSVDVGNHARGLSVGDCRGEEGKVF